jgi:hypothetical protein
MRLSLNSVLFFGVFFFFGGVVLDLELRASC